MSNYPGVRKYGERGSGETQQVCQTCAKFWKSKKFFGGYASFLDWCRNLSTNKFDNNVTDSSSENMINHDFSKTNPEVTIDPAPPSQNFDVPNQGISSSFTASDPSIFEKLGY